jgi:hypothetical protein
LDSLAKNLSTALQISSATMIEKSVKISKKSLGRVFITCKRLLGR